MKYGRNFTKRPTKNPAAKKIGRSVKFLFFVFIKALLFLSFCMIFYEKTAFLVTKESIFKSFYE